MRNTNTPPHNERLERELLGALVCDPDRVAWAQASGVLEGGAEDFYVGAHREIYRALQAICEGDPLAGRTGGPADIVLLHDELERRGSLERVGGIVYLTQLQGAGVVPINVERYAAGVRNYALRRAALAVLADLAAEAQEGAPDIEGYLAEAVSRVSALRPQRARGGVSFKDHAKDFFARLEAAAEGGGRQDVIPTPWPALNARLEGGWGRGNLVVVQGAPGMGKSAFTLAALVGAGADQGLRCEYYGTEMTGASTWDRAVAQRARVPGANVRSGQLTEAQWLRVTRAVGELKASTCWIEDDPRVTAARICARARHRHATEGLDLIAIDYFQRVAPDSSKASEKRSRTDNLLIAAEMYQNLARELGIVVLLPVQVSGEVQRDCRPPALDDIADCPRLAREAHVVLGLHRPAHYELRLKARAESGKGRGAQAAYAPPDPSLLEVHVHAKRDIGGGGAPVRLRWEGEHYGISAREDRYDEHNLREVR